MSIHCFLLTLWFADSAESSGERVVARVTRNTRAGREFRGTLYPISEGNVVIDPVTEAAKEWILGTPSDKLFEEYNEATLDTENLKAVRDTFKLTVYFHHVPGSHEVERSFR
jgi:hypothetical protein